MLSAAACGGLAGMRFGISQRVVVQAWIGVVAVLFVVLVVATIASGNAGDSGGSQLRSRAPTGSRRAGPGPIAARLSVTRYRAQLVVTPNRASNRNRVALAISRAHRPVTDARVTVTYSMPAMNMANAFTETLRQGKPGTYAAREPVLGMPGTWKMRFEITPRDAKPFTVLIDDHMVR